MIEDLMLLESIVVTAKVMYFEFDLVVVVLMLDQFDPLVVHQF
jgi:hypothetical protein